MELWYNKPATDWNMALPAGNGRLGCMQFGGVAHEQFQLNEDSLWSGGPMHRLNPDAADTLPKVQALLRQGKVPEAERLALNGLSSTPCGMRAYQPLGDLILDFDDLSTDADCYKRSLDLETGSLNVRFIVGNAHYERETFISYPDGVLVLRVSVDSPQGLSLRCRLNRKRCEKAGHLDNSTTYFTGNSNGIRYAAAVRLAEYDGGTSRVVGDTVLLCGVKSAVFLLAAATTYRETFPLQAVTSCLNNAAKQSYDELKKRHLDYICKNFSTCHLNLASDWTLERLPTDVRLKYAATQADPGLDALYFQYGRWLLFAASRPGSLPANLQGIWNDSFFPPWDSKFTININTEMNYWPAAVCGLASCEEPLFDLLARMVPNGQHTAQEMYGCRGFVAHHNTDLWGDTDPQDRYLPASFWPMGAAWLCTHIWRYYLYSCDVQFLRSRFTILEQAVLFFIDFLEQDEDGFYVTNPSVSPENTYILPSGVHGNLCIGSTMDMQILHELFAGYLVAAAELDVSNETTHVAATILPKLRPMRIGKDGRLLEWGGEYGEVEPGHRHISHLYALAPGNEISTLATPKWADAARKTLEYRLANGGGYTGWSRAWIALLWVRLGEGSKWEECLRELYANSTFPNLMDNHPSKHGPVFQMDGNSGMLAAMAECLVQIIYEGMKPQAVSLLPALPPSWQSGSVMGLRLPGGASADILWEKEILLKTTLHATAPWRMRLHYANIDAEIELFAGQSVTLNAALQTIDSSKSTTII